MKTLPPHPQKILVRSTNWIGDAVMTTPAVRTIRETVAEAIRTHKPEDCMFPMPAHFVAEINFKEHTRATRGGFYPGAQQMDSRTVLFESDDWWEVLKFFSFVL